MAFDALDLLVDTQIRVGHIVQPVGVVFGVQDLDNYYWFDLSANDGRYHLYRRQNGASGLAVRRRFTVDSHESGPQSNPSVGDQQHASRSP